MAAGRLLIVDDEPFNLEILSDTLQPAGFAVQTAAGGEQALALLREGAEDLDALLLDRMMPGVNGIDVLQAVQADERLCQVPVIMQTAAAAEQDVVTGIAAGAYYYLTKPVRRELLLAVVRAAVGLRQQRRKLAQGLRQADGVLGQLREGVFHFRTLDEARDLGTLLAGLCPQPQRVGLGLIELLVNAVEHGNLGIGYAEKGALQRSGRWLTEIERRLAADPWQRREARLRVVREPTAIRFTITDQGDGFDWRRFLELDAERAFDSHGRGIAMARKMSFDALHYSDDGRRVQAVVHSPAATPPPS